MPWTYCTYMDPILTPPNTMLIFFQGNKTVYWLFLTPANQGWFNQRNNNSSFSLKIFFFGWGRKRKLSEKMWLGSDQLIIEIGHELTTLFIPVDYTVTIWFPFILVLAPFQSRAPVCPRLIWKFLIKLSLKYILSSPAIVAEWLV